MFALNKKISASIGAFAAAVLLLCGCAGKSAPDMVKKPESTKYSGENSGSNYVASRSESYSEDTMSFTETSVSSVTSSVSESKKTAPEQTSKATSSFSPDKVDTEKTSSYSGKNTVSERETSGTSGTVSSSDTGTSETESHTSSGETQKPMSPLPKVDHAVRLTENVPDNIKEIINRITSAMAEQLPVIDFADGEITQKELEDCLLLVSFTDLESTGVSSKYIVSVNANGYVSKLKLNYTKTLAQSEENRQKLRKTIDEIVSGCKATNEYEIVEYVHDEIIKRCSYDAKSENMLNAFGCLSDGKAVCEGYAKAFVLICSELGIESVPVIGTTTAPDGSEEAHMWDLAKIDGRWYHFDLTWDDPITDLGNDFVKYDYFGLSDQKISEDHKINQIPYFKYPEAVSENGGYFYKNGLSVSNADRGVELITDEINKKVSSGERFVRIQVTDEKEFEKLNKMLFEPDGSGNKLIFKILYQARDDVGTKNFDPSGYKKLVSDEKNILTLILKFK